MSPLPIAQDPTAATPPSPGSGAEPSSRLGRDRLDALRRFHAGDAAAASAAPTDLLPASLQPFRGLAVRTGWPLVVDPEPTGAAFATPLGELLARADAEVRRLLDDHRARFERRLRDDLAGSANAPAAAALVAAAQAMATELALPEADRGRLVAGLAAIAKQLGPAAVLVPFGRRAALVLAHLAARRRLTTARAALTAEIHDLARVAEALLTADTDRRPQDTSPQARVGRMGNLGGLLIDPSRLSQVVSRKRAGNPLADERRARLEAAHALLTGFDHTLAEPLWIVAHNEFAPPSTLGSKPHVRTAVDPCRAAALAFDELAADVVDLVRAIRTVRLESANAFDPEHHPDLLAALDWHGFTAEELALVPPVLVAIRESDLGLGALPSLSRLLLSGRALHVLLVVEENLPPCGEPGESSGGRTTDGPRLELGYLAIGHRRAFVQQASVAFPEPYAQALARALAAGRPSLHVVDAPITGDATTRPASELGLDPWLVASARVSGRAAPLLAYDPTAGETWARRLRFADNPEPAADWPTEELPPTAGAGARAAFTYADAALLDANWRPHFTVASELGDELVPLADWLALPPEEAAQKLPTVWACGADGRAVRLVVTRALADAARDRRDFWRTLEELAGVRNQHVEEAVASARREERQAAERERATLAALHAEALAAARRDAEAIAVERLVSSLFAVAPAFTLPADGGAARQLAAAAATTTATAPAATQSTAAPGPAAAATAAPPAAAADDEPSDAWVDTPLCTSCDECIRKSPNIFAYNADKQAFVKNPRGGTFRDLVVAAEACTAKIIHVGTPWNPAEPELANLAERGRAFR